MPVPRKGGYGREDIKVALSFATHLTVAIDRWQQTEGHRRTGKNDPKRRLPALGETHMAGLGSAVCHSVVKFSEVTGTSMLVFGTASNQSY